MDDTKNSEKIIKSTLAAHLGVNVSDIENDDSFIEDLHLKPNDMTDFLEALSEKGLNTSKIDFNAVDTVSDLIDYLDDQIN